MLLRGPTATATYSVPSDEAFLFLPRTFTPVQSLVFIVFVIYSRATGHPKIKSGPSHPAQAPEHIIPVPQTPLIYPPEYDWPSAVAGDLRLARRSMKMKTMTRRRIPGSVRTPIITNDAGHESKYRSVGAGKRMLGKMQPRKPKKCGASTHPSRSGPCNEALLRWSVMDGGRWGPFGELCGRIPVSWLSM